MKTIIVKEKQLIIFLFRNFVLKYLPASGSAPHFRILKLNGFELLFKPKMAFN